MYFISPNYDELHLITKTLFVFDGFGETEEFRSELLFFFFFSSKYHTNTQALPPALQSVLFCPVVGLCLCLSGLLHQVVRHEHSRLCSLSHSWRFLSSRWKREVSFVDLCVTMVSASFRTDILFFFS